MHDLANFLVYKIKTSNIFNISLSLKDEKRGEQNGEAGGDFFDT